ncbi:MAG: hypothetical protein ACRDBF_16530 [Plesiomonas shigelloides]
MKLYSAVMILTMTLVSSLSFADESMNIRALADETLVSLESNEQLFMQAVNGEDLDAAKKIYWELTRLTGKWIAMGNKGDDSITYKPCFTATNDLKNIVYDGINGIKNQLGMESFERAIKSYREGFSECKSAVSSSN